ncbi:FUSC family protein [Robertkochia flava]|uniref:FUSC family protein n=1 Tax=Robertkochia flava TaxID=3447986 RepID=UPI001CCA8361|nr:FUSC family protein [Robertkochia marina]
MKKVFRFLKSFHFLKGLLISSSALLALLLSYLFFDINTGIGMAFGVLIVSMSDITGLRRHRVGGMFVALFLGVLNYILIQLSKDTLWILYPVTAICVFASSYLSIFGFRASLVSFASLLGIAVSFARPVPLDRVDNVALYIILGGLWYMGIALLIDLITPPVLRNELLNTGIRKTADFLKFNIKQIQDPKDRFSIKRMNELQVSLTELHEQLRNELLTREALQGIGGDQRKQLLATAELIDLFEVIVAQMKEHNHERPAKNSYLEALNTICSFLEHSANNLFHLSHQEDGTNATTEESRQLSYKCQAAIENFKTEVSVSTYTEAIIYLRNLHDYALEIDEKVDCITRFLSESENSSGDKDITEKEKFLTRQTYEPLLFLQHLSLKSPIFRHSLRLVFAILIGMITGQVFSLPQTYWILLTIFVIMRPAYSLTKQRSKQRTAGTILGAGIAAILIFLFRGQLPLILFTYITLTLAFTYVQQNYRTSATFVTIAIILIYVLLTSDPYGVIQYRIIDTLIGAGIALLTNYLILPFWEYRQISAILLNYLAAEQNYLESIRESYILKGQTTTRYRLARKEVFLMMSQLNSAFHRLLQEPKSRQKGAAKLQELVSTSQDLLSATAAMGTYIQIHPTSEASIHFNIYITGTLNTLKKAANLIEPGSHRLEEMEGTVEEARKALIVHYHVLKDKLKRMENAGTTEFNASFREHIKEARILSEQLEWIYRLSVRLYSDMERYLEAHYPD